MFNLDDMKKINLLLNFIIICLFSAELVSRWNNYNTFEYLVKPFLMIWVAVYFYINTREFRRDFFIYLAFLFSWTGDLFLMVAHSNEMLFYAGVGGFFLAQLSYIKAFLETGSKAKSGFLFMNPAWALPFLIYLAIMLYFILGGMHGVMIPVIVIYAVSLISMSMSALNRKGLVSTNSFQLVFFGSVSFVISDSMIALNKFYEDIPRSSFLIMLTYFVAQYLIMMGLIKEKRLE
jgi:uncharacterized membrane protein YhhN